MRSPDEGQGAFTLEQAQREMEALVRQHGARLLAHAQGFFGPDDAEDAVQEVFMRYWARTYLAPRTEPSRTPLGRLMRQVVDLAEEGWRQGGRRVDLLHEGGMTLKQFQSPHHSSPLISSIRSWERPDRQDDPREPDPVLKKALEAVPIQQREIFLYVHAQGMTYAEVAELTGKSEANVRKLCSLACIRLRRELDALGYKPPVGYGAEPRRATRPARPRRAGMELVLDGDDTDASTQEGR